MSVVLGGDPYDDYDFSHIWKDDERIREIVRNAGKKSNKDNKMSKDFTDMSKQLKDALDMEQAFKAYIREKEEYCRKYNVKIAYPSSEVERLQMIINSDDKPLTSKKTPKPSNTFTCDSDLLL